MLASSKVGKRPVLKPGLERRGVHGVVIGLERDGALQAQARENEGDRFAMAVRNAAAETPPASSPTAAARHVGRRRGLVDEHQFQRIEVELTIEPPPPPFKDVGPVLFAARADFFERDVVAVEEPRDHRRRHLLAPRTLQTARFGQRQVRLAPVKAQKVIRMRLHALRTRVAAHRQRRGGPALAQGRHPPIALAKLIPNRRAARQLMPSLANRRNHPLAQIHRRKAPSRAASDSAPARENQISCDSGNPRSNSTRAETALAVEGRP